MIRRLSDWFVDRVTVAVIAGLRLWWEHGGKSAVMTTLAEYDHDRAAAFMKAIQQADGLTARPAAEVFDLAARRPASVPEPVNDHDTNPPAA
ncbi:hypothetical protein Q0812_13270 [Brevundimonas sp. 2R-24]|uniref:Uncharacterized protein n=1 Tax=Peiella sedimenti TaxID=3061083 RepID=A0ABT8SPA2_9CAUL|nr:hypothetical protein [Caulobacteraceae bacterium XZ-24]